MLHICRRVRLAEKADLFRNGTPKIVEGFANVGRVVVGFVGVL